MPEAGYPKIKICGVREPETALAAIRSGADLLGLVFYPPSTRYLPDQAALRLCRAVRQHRTEGRTPALAGLFVNAALPELEAAAGRYGLDYLQLSGDESPEQVGRAARLRPVIKTLRLPGGAGPDEALRQAARYGEMDNIWLLLDTHRPGHYGGTGQTGDWQLARTVAERYPTLLAGGLNPQNVGAAVEQVRPWGVDVSSGVESAPGLKDPEKIKAFCQAVSMTYSTLRHKDAKDHKEFL